MRTVAVASGLGVAAPLANRMSLWISTSRNVRPRRTVTSFCATISASACWILSPSALSWGGGLPDSRAAVSAAVARAATAAAPPAVPSVARDGRPNVGRSSTWRTRTLLTGVTEAGPVLAAAVCIDGRSNDEPRSWVSPSWIGVIVRGAPPNADDIASAMTRYLPSLTEDTAYITTKNASSSVTRSP